MLVSSVDDIATSKINVDYMMHAQVEALVAMYTEEAEEQLLAGGPDYVIDAIDNIDTKACAAPLHAIT